jgi:hypothetical protein
MERTGSDIKHDRNLGIVYQDDINKQGWTLESNGAKTLTQIDAVFVTVEPKREKRQAKRQATSLHVSADNAQQP